MAKYYVGTSSRQFKAPDQRVGDTPYYIVGAKSLADAQRKLAKMKRKFPGARWYVTDSKLKRIKTTAKATRKPTKKRRKRKRTTRRRARSILDLSW